MLLTKVRSVVGTRRRDLEATRWQDNSNNAKTAGWGSAQRAGPVVTSSSFYPWEVQTFVLKKRLSLWPRKLSRWFSPNNVRCKCWRCDWKHQTKTFTKHHVLIVSGGKAEETYTDVVCQSLSEVDKKWQRQFSSMQKWKNCKYQTHRSKLRVAFSFLQSISSSFIIGFGWECYFTPLSSPLCPN